MAAKGDGTAAAQKQLLALVQSKGNAEKAKQVLIQSGLVDELVSPSSRLETATALLRRAVAERARSGTKLTPKKKGVKMSKSDEKQWALVAAKVAQSVIKLYIGAAPNGAVDADLISALDLASLALSASSHHESLVKLGDLVVDNMLYQVAKKFSEIPQYTVSALWIFAALHLRLWHHHAVMCSHLNQQIVSDALSFEGRVGGLFQNEMDLTLDDLVALCTFPSPQDLHTLQYTRFVISVVNTGVNMLLAAGKNEAILALAKKLEPWINHLSRIPGVESKLPVSFSDRLFRVLWKCAATVDIEMTKGSHNGSDLSLSLRSVAVSFMLKCPSYSNAYFAQQVHRVGLQYEKKNAPLTSEPTAARLRKFYTEAAGLLFAERKPHQEESSVDWDYMNWMEHFAVVSEAQPYSYASVVEAMSALHHAMGHTTASKTDNIRLVQGCLSALIGCVALDYHLSSPDLTSIQNKQALGNALYSALASEDRDMILSAVTPSFPKTGEISWIDTVKAYLNGLSVAAAMAGEVLVVSDACSAFVLRTVRKILSRLHASITPAEKFVTSISELIVSSIVASGDLLSSLRKNEAVKLSDAVKDSFMSLEGRTRRLAVSLCAKKSVSLPDDEAPTWLEVMKRNTECFQLIVGDVVTGTRDEKLSQYALLSDLQAIARETYVCATHFYKTHQNGLVTDSLESAFSLAENYYEHVMCNREMVKNPSLIEAAHNSLRADAIATLLAFSLRQQGNIPMSRKCLGHAILYSSNPAGVTSGDAIEKYVIALMEEYDVLAASTRDSSAAHIVDSLCTSISVAWAVRKVSEDDITFTIRRLRDGFDRLTTRSLDRLRFRSEKDDSLPTEERESSGRIEGSTKIELVIWKWLWKRDGTMGDDAIEAMVNVVDSLGTRKVAFFDYYSSRDSSRALELLRGAHGVLTQALGILVTAGVSRAIEVGGCYGWRGVISMELCQMAGYSRISDVGQLPNDDMTQRIALDDIKKCISHWHEVPSAELLRSHSHVFNSYGVAVCLDAICNTLSLMSQFQLEAKARKLLLKVQSLQPSTVTEFPPSLPNRLLQPSQVHDNHLDPSNETAKVKTSEDAEQGVALLSLVDADIGLCLTLASSGDIPQARCHLQSAVTAMDKFRVGVKITSGDLQLFSAGAMREIALAMATSEVSLQEGKPEQAIREAKLALSICWKVSKRVGVVDPYTDKYELPRAVKMALGKHIDQSHRVTQQMYFEAIECWSWDALLAARLILSRIAHLYTVTNQPFRSSIYYAEAMALVGGVVPVATRTRPFFEFAQLQILAERTTHASAVHQLLTTFPDELDEPVDTSVLTQKCEVYLQHGDLCVLDGDVAGATLRYKEALAMLERIPQRTHAANSVACGCYRRILKVQLGTGSPADNIDELIDTLKNLKRALKKCSDLLEYALATCQLVQASLTILRSPSPKAFQPPAKLLATMEEVLERCDRMELPYLSQDIRFTMGQVFLMISESEQQSVDDHQYFDWGAAGYLSCYSIVGKAGDESSSARIDRKVTSPSARAFTTSLQKSVTADLPPNWVFVSLTINEFSDFAISVIPTNGANPVSFYVGNVEWRDFSKALSEIIEKSRTTLFGNKSEDAVEWTSDRKKQWWTTRKELDDRLSALITKLQNALGFWRALVSLTPNVLLDGTSKDLVENAATLIHRGSKALTTRSRWLLSAVAAEQTTLTDSEIERCIDQIAIEEDVSLKGELVQDLIQTIRKGGVKHSDPDTVSTILILHPRLEKFPWEGVDVLRDRAVTRMPSLELAIKNTVIRRENDISGTHQTGYTHIDSSKVSFLLNPAGDLKATQKNLEPLFRRGEAELGWGGVVGEIPDEDWMRETLQQSDLFVFCGHGSGEKYFHRDKIATLGGQRCAAAFLFGCSSGHLEREGIFGPHGAVVSYLQAGAPCVLAMLWDVTDKDVDLMSKDIIENWLLSTNDTNSTRSECLSVALQRSRQLCKLQHLNGLAAICYGLPIRVAKPDESQTNKRRKLR